MTTCEERAAIAPPSLDDSAHISNPRYKCISLNQGIKTYISLITIQTMKVTGVALGIILLLSPAAAAATVAGLTNGDTTKEVFVQGSSLAGGTNGVYFDADDSLYVCGVIGGRISRIDPITGRVVDEMGYDDGVYWPDDITIGPDGTTYWTDPMAGTVGRKLPTGESELLYDIGSYPDANAITLNEDGTKLFFSQCFYQGPEGNGIYQLDLTTMKTTPVMEGIPACAANGMDYRHGALYAPRLFEGRVIRIDLQQQDDVGATKLNTTLLPTTPKATAKRTPTITDVTTDVEWPVAVKFDSKGNLFVLDTNKGEVLKIDLEAEDKTSNAQVIAKLPFTGVDNLAFDGNDRLYVSSWSTGSITEIKGDGGLRVVLPGSFSSTTAGLAVVDDILFAAGPLALHGFDADSGEQIHFTEALLGFSDLIFPSTIVAAGEGRLAALSFIANTITMWDVKNDRAIFHAPNFIAPSDALLSKDGMIVVEAATGNIIFATGPELEDREILFNIPGAFFLAGNDQDVYLSNTLDGSILQIIEAGEVLEEPKMVRTQHVAPEGIVLDERTNSLLIVDTGAGTLEQVHLDTGDVSVLAKDLSFRPPLPEFGLAFGFTNDVAVHDGYAYVNADGDNVIYRIPMDVESGSAVGDDDDSGSIVNKSKYLYHMVITAMAGACMALV